MQYINGRIAQQIIEQQNADGTWGTVFHSLAIPNNRYPLTTEQALRRLKILGFTIGDEPIKKAVDCMTACLNGERKIDDYWEKTIDWELYTKLMLSAWIRIFEPDNEVALSFARRWSNIIEKAFASGRYDDKVYLSAYNEEFYQNEKGVKAVDFVSFYELSLLQGLLSTETERSMLDYVISYEKGIYYIYGKPIREVPKVFASIETSRYLAAIEILSGYETAKKKLGFVAEWLVQNREEDGQWDLEPKVKDHVYFPLSDSWRKAEDRKADCTERVRSILKNLQL